MDINKFADEIGPEKVVEVYDPVSGMKGFTVLDNTVLGPAKGGIRMTADVDVKEVFRLARAMTLKNALAGLPFGGGKSGIIYDRKTQSNKKEDFMKAFAKALRNLSPSEYVAAPDINTTEKDMEIYVKANGHFNSATGKPLRLCKKINGKKACGLPHELGSTGFGVCYATKVALEYKKMNLEKSRIAIQGFGNVGTFTFSCLQKNGGKIVAVSDSKGCLYNPNGIDFMEILKVKEEKGSVVFGKGKKLSGDKIFELPVDVLIPAAQPDVINKKNISRVKAKIIVEAANIPIPLDIEKKLSKKVLIVPDFVANAGGVISSYAEYIGKNTRYMEKLIKQKLIKNTGMVLRSALRRNISPRQAATEIALDRIMKGMRKGK
jgi:glutamate dehydrogenase (NAD(P)+)